MKKILILVPSYSLGGGAEKILSYILCHGDFSAYHIDIVEIEKGNKGYEKLPNSIKIINHLTSYTYPKIINVLLMQVGKYFPSLIRKYLIKQDDYDVEIMFELMYPDVNFTKRNIKKIHWVHGSIEDLAQKKYEWRKKHYQKHFAQATQIVAISEKTKQSILAIYPDTADKLQLIYNGYDFAGIKEKAKENLEIEIAEKSICSVGRIEYHKGSDNNLEILKSLHQKGYPYHLYYIGSGDLEEELKNRVKAYQLSDYVHFLGYQKNPYPYLKQMKVLLSSSLQEGFPGVYVEALTLGVPFVSTDVGGVAELSQNGLYGKVFYDNKQAEDYLINYLEAKESLDKKSLAHFMTGFSIEKQVEAFIKLID